MKYYLDVLINNTSKMHIPLALALALPLALICIGDNPEVPKWYYLCNSYLGGDNPEVPMKLPMPEAVIPIRANLYFQGLFVSICSNKGLLDLFTINTVRNKSEEDGSVMLENVKF